MRRWPDWPRTRRPLESASGAGSGRVDRGGRGPDAEHGVVGKLPLDDGERYWPQFVMVHGGAQESDGPAGQLDRRPGLGQLVGLAGEMQQHEPTRWLAEVLDARHRLLAAIAALVEVDGRSDPP